MSEGMGGTPRWRRTPGTRRSDISAAALEIFSAEGLESAKMDGIALRAGLSKGTIYRYFSDKDQLYRDVVLGTLDSLLVPLPRINRLTIPEEFLDAAWKILNEPSFGSIYQLSMGGGRHLQSLRDEFNAVIDQRLVKPLALVLGQISREQIVSSEIALQRARIAIATLLGLALNSNDQRPPAHAVTRFIQNACELDAGFPQADGF